MQQEKRHYELYFILDPMLNNEQYEKAVGKFLTLLNNNNADVEYKSSYGLKKLAYSIEGKSTGFCDVIQFKALPDFIRILEIDLKRDEKILRFLTTSLDKHAIAYNAKKRAKDADKTDDNYIKLHDK